MQLEVEQKFQISHAADLERTLQSLGFVSRGTVTFVDWYFDNDENYLSTNDHWLRYRQKSGRGQWELKVGRGHDGTTVYEEIECEQACIYAVSCLKEGGFKTRNEFGLSEMKFDGFDIPRFPESVGDALTYGLRPFCRLETCRSSWHVEKVESPYIGLVVDLDCTNTGHTVGEVEMLCDEAGVEAGKVRVQNLIATLCGGTDSCSDTAIGKLEHFLLLNRPWHYDMCVQSGVLRKVSGRGP
jgi:CYTH domain